MRAPTRSTTTGIDAPTHPLECNRRPRKGPLVAREGSPLRSCGDLHRMRRHIATLVAVVGFGLSSLASAGQAPARSGGAATAPVAEKLGKVHFETS